MSSPDDADSTNGVDDVDGADPFAEDDPVVSALADRDTRHVERIKASDASEAEVPAEETYDPAMAEGAEEEVDDDSDEEVGDDTATDLGGDDETTHYGDAEETGVFDAGQLVAGDEDFDALGFDTSFGAMPSGFGTAPEGGSLGDADDTPPGGIYVGPAEDQVVLDAHTIGRALAEARGEETNFQLPDMGDLQAGLIGIDIGAAKAVVARFEGDGRHEIVPNSEDDLATPAQIFFDEDGEQLVGREARQMAPSAPGRAVGNLKEMLSDPDFQFSGAGSESLDAEDVLAIFLKRLVKDVSEHAGEAPTHVALAAPAWFGVEQIERLKGAVAETGLHLVGVTEEALAASVPYSLRLPDLQPRRALVFDCGHAALGVAIVRCGGGDIEVLAKASRRKLGSSAWDRLIAKEAARVFKRKYGHDPYEDPGAEVDLLLRAEDAKRSLSQRPQCTVSVTSQGKTLKVGFTRAGLEKAGRKLIEGARELANSVREEAELSDWSKIDALILTGGGSRTPALRRMVIDETGLKPERGISPEEGVAVGALYWGIGERHRLNNND